MPVSTIYKARNQEVDKSKHWWGCGRWELTVYRGVYTCNASWKCSMAALTTSQHVESRHPAMPSPVLPSRGTREQSAWKGVPAMELCGIQGSWKEPWRIRGMDPSVTCVRGTHHASRTFMRIQRDLWNTFKWGTLWDKENRRETGDAGKIRKCFSGVNQPLFRSESVLCTEEWD